MTATVNTHRVESAEALLAALDDLLPEVTAHAAEGERLRTMPPDLVPLVEAAGLFRMLRVRALDGLEVAPPTVVEVIERLAHADASTAWTVLIGTTANAFLGWLEPSVARAMIDGRPDAASSCVFAPRGTAVPADPSAGTFRVDGRWSFNSGITHAAWRQVGVLVGDAGGPPTGDGPPDMRLAFVPAGVGEPQDTWDTMGLRGTGSHDLVLDGVEVPAEHLMRPGDGNRHDGAYARLSLGDLVQIGVIAFPLGIARRALEEFAALARTKTRGMTAPWSVADDAQVQAELGRAEGELAAARAFVDTTVGELWDAVQAGGEVPASARGRLGMATQHAMRAAVSVTDTVMRHAGAGASFVDSPLQRCFRDVHTAAQHVFYAPDVDRRVARARLGITDGGPPAGF